jgi:hypothetical protein
MGNLDEPGLERLVGAGCSKCGALKLMFRTYVDGLLPIMGAEPVGRITWVYDGEKFIDGGGTDPSGGPGDENVHGTVSLRLRQGRSG